MSRGTVPPWVVEIRCSNRSYKPQMCALSRELAHLPSELFDTSHAVGLRIDVLATDAAEALRYVHTRINAARSLQWVQGIDYNLSVTPRHE